MKTQCTMRPLVVAIGLLVKCLGQAQVTNPSNNASSGDYVGCDATSPFPLEIRQNDNQPIDWYTNAIHRMRLYQDQVGNLPLFPPPGAGTVPVQQDGFLGISGTPGFFAPGSYGPFSRLHLADLDPNNEGPFHYALPWGYRTWMRNGVTFTGNHDHAYIGQRYYDHDQTDLVIHWSDNADKSPFGPDRLRFLFTTDNTGAAAGSRSQEGLEFMRMFPVNAMQGWVGVGNFAQPTVFPSGDPEPTERLDILDRTIRLREFAAASPNSWQDVSNTFNRILVVDPSDGRVYWRPESTINPSSPTADCDWELENSAASGSSISHNVVTAYGSSDECPDKDDGVGIGVATPLAKLHVEVNRATDDVPNDAVYVHMTTTDEGAETGVKVRMDPASVAGYSQLGVSAEVYNGEYRNSGVGGRAYITEDITVVDGNTGVGGYSIVTDGTVGLAAGVYASAGVSSGASVTNNAAVFATATGGATSYGLKADAAGATTNFGAYLDTWNTDATNFGLYAKAANASTNYGVFGQASGGTTNWAGYFQGAVNINGPASCTASAWTSDGNLKTNIEELSDATALLEALRPRTYLFDIASHPSINLPAGLQRGFVAQELEQVMPDLVSEVRFAGQFDSTGVETQPGETVKAVNYIGLIPVLVAAMQEQNARIAQQDARIAEMQAALASCCATHGSGDQRMMLEDSGTVTGEARSLRIVPNPFNEGTTLHYTLEKAGRMQLLANSADGKQLKVLHEAQQEAGTYQHAWSTTELSPGVYYVTLLLEGEPIVKKAVKVVR